jgi:hypothetical protein
MKKRILLSVGIMFACFIGTAQVSTFPYLEDFEAEANCGTGCGAVCNTLIDFINPTTDDLDWTVDVGGTGSGGTGPSVDHTIGSAAGVYVYVETSCSGTGYPNFTANLESPWFDFTTLSDMNLSFWYHAFGATQGVLNVEARIGLAGAWSNVAGPIQDDLDQWQEWSGCLGAAYSGMDSVQVRWSYLSGTSFTGDIALDDIMLSAIAPVDVALTMLSAPSGCGLSATESIDITVCNAGDSLAPGTVIPISYTVNGGAAVNESITLTAGLASRCNGSGCINYTFTTTVDFSASGTYNVMAWTAHASDANATNDSAMVMSTSSPSFSGIPYYEDFESGQGGWTVDNATSGSWDFGTPANAVINSAASGDSAFVTNLSGPYNVNEDGNVTSPCLDISSANGSEVVSLKVWWESENSWDGANLFSSVDGGSSWSQVGAFGDPTNWYNDNSINSAPQGSQEGWTGRTSTGNGSGGWVCATHTLDSTMMVDNSSMILRIGFGSDGSVTDEGFAFDNVAIGYPITYNGLVQDSVLAVCDEYIIDAGPGYYSYNWSTGETSQSITVSATGDYTVCVSDSMGMVADDTQYVEILPYISPDLVDVSTCVGDTVTIDAMPDPTGYSYLWSTGATTQTINVTMPGTYTVTKTDTANGCSMIDSATVSYNVPVSIADVSICIGDTATLDATTANATYLWSTGDSTATITSATAGVYTVMVTDTALGCAPSNDSVILTINALPLVNLGADSTVCGSLTLDATTADVVYMWNTGDTTGTISASTSGTYDVIITDINTGCSNTDTVDVIVNALPFVNLGGDTTLCDTLTYTLDAGTAVSYLWSDASTNQTLVTSVTGTYSVTVSDSIGCSATDAVDVTFISCPTGINEYSTIEVSYYPNPTTGSVSLAFSEVITNPGVLTITNISGKVVSVQQITDPLTVIDLQNLSSGSYIFKLQLNDSISVDKVILNR